MSDRDWFDDYEQEALRKGDRERLLLGYLHWQAYQFRETDPDTTLTLLEQGRALASRLGEPWWVLFYQQQRVHALLHFKQDYREVLDLAIANVMEVRKPAFARFPRANMIHSDLVSAYRGIDPVGYDDTITQALDYLDSQIGELNSERYLLLGARRQQALYCGRLEEARHYAQATLVLAEKDPDVGRANHFSVFAQGGICEVAFLQGQWDILREAVVVGEELAARVGHQVELAGFRLWHALVCYRDGERVRARSLHRQAVGQLARLRMPPDYSYRDAECCFHEMTGHPERALRVRDAELASIRDRGRFFYEAELQVKRCELLVRLGKLTANDEEMTRQAIARLRQPARLLQRLECLLGKECP
jgi:hypothetical protein